MNRLWLISTLMLLAGLTMVSIDVADEMTARQAAVFAAGLGWSGTGIAAWSLHRIQTRTPKERAQ